MWPMKPHEEASSVLNLLFIIGPPFPEAFLDIPLITSPAKLTTKE